MFSVAKETAIKYKICMIEIVNFFSAVNKQKQARKG